MKEFNKMLFEAIEENDINGVNEAIKRGANLDAVDEKNGDTVLTAAVRVGNLEVIQKLADSRVNLDALNEKGFSALMLASRLGDVNAVQKLIDCGANVKTENNGVTALTIAIACCRNEIVDILIENKANVKEVAPQIKASEAPVVIKSNKGLIVVADLDRSYKMS